MKIGLITTSFILVLFWNSCSSGSNTRKDSHSIVPVISSSKYNIADSLNSMRNSIFADTTRDQKIGLTDCYGQTSHLWYKNNIPCLLSMRDLPNDEGIPTGEYLFFFFNNSGKLFLIMDTNTSNQVFFSDDYLYDLRDNNKATKINITGPHPLEASEHYLLDNYQRWSIRISCSFEVASKKMNYKFYSYPPEFNVTATSSIKVFRSPDKKGDAKDLKKGTIFQFSSISIINEETWIEVWITTPDPTDDESWYIPAKGFFMNVDYEK